MVANKFGFRSGVSLIEVMIAIVVLSVGVIAASGYRYYSTLDITKADSQAAAARIGWTLCESWRGVKGDPNNYNPVTCLTPALTIAAGAGPTTPTGFTLMGKYQVILNDVNYFVNMSWKDLSTSLRILNVAVAWAQAKRGQNTLNDTDKQFKVVTYTQY
jgi:prepilin-type N-terminal cleavage/methylation domain-containing protein